MEEASPFIFFPLPSKADAEQCVHTGFSVKARLDMLTSLFEGFWFEGFIQLLSSGIDQAVTTRLCKNALFFSDNASLHISIII